MKKNIGIVLAVLLVAVSIVTVSSKTPVASDVPPGPWSITTTK